MHNNLHWRFWGYLTRRAQRQDNQGEMDGFTLQKWILMLVFALRNWKANLHLLSQRLSGFWFEFICFFPWVFCSLKKLGNINVLLCSTGYWDYEGHFSQFVANILQTFNLVKYDLTAYSLLWHVGFLECELYSLRSTVFSRSDTWMNAQVSLLIENKHSRSVYECWLGKIIFFKCYRIGTTISLCAWVYFRGVMVMQFLGSVKTICKIKFFYKEKS